MSKTLGIAAVTGGSGFIGGALVRRLTREQPVRVLARRRDAWTAWCEREGIELVLGDLHDQRALANLVQGATTVYHCAAFMGKRNAARSRATNVDGTERLARAAARAGVSRCLYVSSISVFGATRCPGGTITERVTPTRLWQLNQYARTKYLGEGRLGAVARDTGMAFTIVRPTNVYGPDSGPWFHQYARLIARVPVAFGSAPIDLVYLDDVVEALILAARSPDGANEVFHIGHEMVSLQQFVTMIAAVTGQRVWRLPPWLDRAVCMLVENAFRAVTRTRMSLSLTRPVWYPHRHASRTIGYDPQISLVEGFWRLAEWRCRTELEPSTHRARARQLTEGAA